MPFSLSSPVLRQPSSVISAPRHTIRIHTPITPLPASPTSPPASSSPQTVTSTSTSSPSSIPPSPPPISAQRPSYAAALAQSAASSSCAPIPLPSASSPSLPSAPSAISSSHSAAPPRPSHVVPPPLSDQSDDEMVELDDLPPAEMAVDTGEVDSLEFALSPSVGLITEDSDCESVSTSHSARNVTVATARTDTASPSSLHLSPHGLTTAASDEVSALQCDRVSAPSSPTAPSDVHTDVARPHTSGALPPGRPVANNRKKRRSRKRGGSPSSLTSPASPFTVSISKPRPSTSISPPPSKRMTLLPSYAELWEELREAWPDAFKNALTPFSYMTDHRNTSCPAPSAVTGVLLGSTGRRDAH